MEQDVTDRFTAVELRISGVEGRVTAGEATDLRLETSVSELTKKLDALTATQKLQLEILQRLDLVAANPSVKIILAIVATVLASWAASKGLK